MKKIFPLTPYLFGGTLVFVLLSFSIMPSWLWMTDCQGNTNWGLVLVRVILAVTALAIGLWMLLWDIPRK